LLWSADVASFLDIKIDSIIPVSGGDIAKAFLIKSPGKNLFAKSMSGDGGASILRAEQEGLNAIFNCDYVSTPQVLGLIDYNDDHLLIMEYIEHGRFRDDKALGKMLASLHMNSSEGHGWDGPNFIGSLDQSNEASTSWPEFWRDQRLRPQIDLARQNDLLPTSISHGLDKLLSVVHDIAPDANPSLLHGDLWNGNVVFNVDGEPFFIDPSVYFGHREVDLAMMMLFGGFEWSTFDVYNAEFPLLSDWQDRMAFYQIYYVLVHVNLFGAGYLSSLEEKVGNYV
jgi:fructosamine-3-kinase